MNYSDMKFECKDSEVKDHYRLFVEGVFWMELERSELRSFIEACDNAIAVGLVTQDTSMTAEDYSLMIKQAREAALSEDDEDCVMCGS